MKPHSCCIEVNELGLSSTNLKLLPTRSNANSLQLTAKSVVRGKLWRERKKQRTNNAKVGTVTYKLHVAQASSEQYRTLQAALHYEARSPLTESGNSIE